MRGIQTENVRDIAFIGCQSCGESSLVEALVLSCGATTCLCNCSEGSVISDWENKGNERGLLLPTSLVPVEFNETKINVLDTPAFTDTCRRASDSMILSYSVPCFGLGPRFGETLESRPS